MSAYAWVAVPAGLGLALVWRSLLGLSARRRATERLYQQAEERPERSERPTETRDELWGSWLERWLFISGFRSPKAATTFLAIEGAVLLFGAVVALLIQQSGIHEVGVQWLVEIPGGIGAFLGPVLVVAPWILFALIALVPVARVRSRRHAIVRDVERDLPMALALLATLVESGAGFDAAIERVLDSMNPDRPLAREFRVFRGETQGGVPRLTCFRRMAQRLDVSSVSIFVSAIVHAEHVGGGIAESLRRQADEVWSRRRELAIQRAQMLPTKLAFPLVLCFLPGIFVFTFGPTIAQFLSVANGVLEGGS